MPNIYTLAMQFRAKLLARDKATAKVLLDAYGKAYAKISAKLDGILTKIEAAQKAGTTVTESWLYEKTRLASVLNQIETEVNKVAIIAEKQITLSQSAAVKAATANAEALILAGLGDKADALGYFSPTMPRGAFESLVGRLSDGSPLDDLLRELGPQASALVKESLLSGIASGQGVKEIARNMKGAFGRSSGRALLIARQEVLSSYREATKANYQANADVLNGWVWSSAKDRRTCLSCWLMDGTLHPLTESLDDHVGGRCVMLPETKTWTQLGFPEIEESTRRPDPGAVAFTRLSQSEQREIMGNAAFDAWQAGDARLEDFAGQRNDARWGSSRYTKPLSEVVGRQRAQAYHAGR